MAMQKENSTTSDESVGSRNGVNVAVAENVSAPSLAADALISNGRAFQSVKGMYSKIFEEAVVSSVDPLRCISIEKLRSRPFCRWGIRMIKDSITGHANVESFVNGFVSTGKFAVLAEIPKEFTDLIVEHFVEEDGKSEAEASSIAASGKWYHVVDGGHLHLSITEVIFEFSEKFAGFRWPVVVIPWQSDDLLRAIGRMCNEMQKEAHYIDFPLPDAMQSLRDLIDVHSKRSGVAIIPGTRVKIGFIKEVMEIYSGSPGYSCNTMRNVCGIVLKMSNSFVNAMRTLLTEECDDYWKSLGSKRPFGNDTRIYKKLISSQSLKGTATFLDHKKMTDQDRIDVVHRLRFLARERESFKAFQPSEIEAQSRCVLAARGEMEKFETFLGGESWPNDMENLRRNISQTTLLDGEIKEHIGAGKKLLPAMVSAYIKATGAHGSQKIGQYERRVEIGEAVEADEVVATAACRQRATRGNSAFETDGSDTEDVGVQHVDGMARGGVVDAVLSDASDVSGDDDAAAEEITEDNRNEQLERCGLHIETTTLLDFERNSVNLDASFDFVLADPFQKVPMGTAAQGNERNLLDELVDDKGVNLFVQCLRRLLSPGSYCFIFLDWDKLSQWTACCKSSHFEVVCDPFLVMKDAGRVQKMTMKGLQSVYEPAIVLKKPGRHSKGFEIEKSAPYLHLPACRMPRWCNVIDGVPPPAQRLTFKPSRAHVRPNEKPCALYIELFKTFCPTGGKILDPFAGVLTTGLACIASNNRCVLLETDERCLSHAVPRLREFAKAKVLELEAAPLIPEDINQSTEEAHTEQDCGNEGLQVTDNSSTESSLALERRDDTDLHESTTHGEETLANEATASGGESDVAFSRIQKNDIEKDLLAVRRPSDGCESISNITSIRSRSQRQNSPSEGSSSKTASSVDVCDKCPTASGKPMALKRIRATRRSTTHSSIATGAESSTPSSFRRSRRTRRPAARYDL